MNPLPLEQETLTIKVDGLLLPVSIIGAWFTSVNMLEGQLLTVGKVIEWFGFVLSYVPFKSVHYRTLTMECVFLFFTSVLGANWQKKNSKSNLY